jgi:hypothetical protein
MASRAKVRRLWREVRLASVLLVWAAFGTSLFVYFDSGIILHRAAPAAPATQADNQADNDDNIYTGSIVVVPRDGDRCWRMTLDNRTGRMWGDGYVDCDAVVSTLAENNRKSGIRSVRMQSISSAFRNGGN